MIKIGIKIQIKKEVLDSEGRALLELLNSEEKKIIDCHYGKYIELQINETDEKKALEIAQKATEKGLYNPLIESFSLEVIK